MDNICQSPNPINKKSIVTVIFFKLEIKTSFSIAIYCKNH